MPCHEDLYDCQNSLSSSLRWAGPVIDIRQRVVIRKDYRETLPRWLCWSSTTSRYNHFVPQGGNLTLVGKMYFLESAATYRLKMKSMHLLQNKKHLLWYEMQHNAMYLLGQGAMPVHVRKQVSEWKYRIGGKIFGTGSFNCAGGGTMQSKTSMYGEHILRQPANMKGGIFAKRSRTQNIQDMHPLDWPCNHHHG